MPPLQLRRERYPSEAFVTTRALVDRPAVDVKHLSAAVLLALPQPRAARLMSNRVYGRVVTTVTGCHT